MFGFTFLNNEIRGMNFFNWMVNFHIHKRKRKRHVMSLAII